MLDVLKNLLLYQGVDRSDYLMISDQLMESNRRSLIAFSALGTVTFAALSAFSMLGTGIIRINSAVYFTGFVLLAVILAVNLTLSRKSRLLTVFSMYVMLFVLLDVGIYLSLIISPGERTAAYLAILTIVPALFSMRPLCLALLIISANLIYGALALNLQQGDLLMMNLVNVTVFGIMSIAVGTYASFTKAARFNSERISRLLLETDQMTGVFNRRSYEAALKAQETSYPAITVGVFDVNGLKEVNDSRGHEAGDELIRGAASCISETFNDYGRCYRIGGDEFVVIIAGEDDQASLESMEMNFRMAVSNWRGSQVERLSISYGTVSCREMGDCTLSQMVAEADRRMYAAKASYYSDNKLDRRRYKAEAR